jgi:hypothetical protein
MVAALPTTQNRRDCLQSAAQDYDSAHTWTLRLAANSARIKFNRRSTPAAKRTCFVFFE